MASPDNFDPLIPIPNDPFDFLATWNFNTPSSRLIYGPGFTIDAVNGSVSVVQLPPPIIGTVTQVTGGIGIVTAPVLGVTVSGSLALKALPFPLVPGAYSNVTATVDQYGKVTVASDGVPAIYSALGESPVSVTGAAPTLTVAISAATTLTPGVTQLADDLVTTLNSEALTGNQGYILNNDINTIPQVPVEGQFYAGTFSLATQTVVTATALGLAAGYIPGQSLPFPGSSAVEGYVVVVDNGTFVPPGGIPAGVILPPTAPQVYTIKAGDLLYCGNTYWLYIRNTLDYPYATTTAAGLVQLATQASVLGFTNNTLACTPYSLARLNATNTERGWVYLASDTETQQLLSPLKAITPANLSALPGTLFLRGIIQLVDSYISTSTTEGVTINAVKQVYDFVMLKSQITAVGDIISGTGPNAQVTVPRGTATYRLQVDDAEAAGVAWRAFDPPQVTKVGTIFWFATSNALKMPPDWVVCDGGVASSLPETSPGIPNPYYDLFQVIGYTYGGAGATFSLPDLRGTFIRGWSGAGGTDGTIDAPRVFGSTQTSSVVQHTHPLPSFTHNHVINISDPSHNHQATAATVIGPNNGYFGNKDTGPDPVGPASVVGQGFTMTAANALSSSLNTLVNGPAPTPLDQTYPVNFSLLPIIKYTYGGATLPPSTPGEYFVSASVATAPPSTTFAVNILTVNVARGTTLYWELGGPGVVASLFSPAVLTGTTTVGIGNLASFNVTTAASYPSPPYSLEIKIYSDAARLNQVGNTAFVSLT
jgi:microcystin-dependent protein